jgi:hypothetical protein
MQTCAYSQEIVRVGSTLTTCQNAQGRYATDHQARQETNPGHYDPGHRLIINCPV